LVLVTLRTLALRAPSPESYLIFLSHGKRSKVSKERTFSSSFFNPRFLRLLTGSGRTGSMRMSSLRVVWTSSWAKVTAFLSGGCCLGYYIFFSWEGLQITSTLQTSRKYTNLRNLYCLNRWTDTWE